MKFLYILLLSFCCVGVNAQRIQKQIINSNGTTYTSSGVSLRTSVGEPIVGSFENAAVTTLSQGFFTGSKKRVVVVDPPVQSIPDGFSIYPNAVKDVLFVRGNLVFAKQMQFFDVTGNRLLAQNLDNGGIILVQSLPANSIVQNSILDEGTIISTSGCTDPGFKISMNGYFIDK